MNEKLNVVCYARVSSLTQDLDLQISELQKFCNYRNYKIIRMISDKQSGKNTQRQGFQEMISLIEKNTLGIQAVIITKLDRIGRNLSDLLKIVEYLKDHHIQLIAVHDPVDTSTPQGVLFLQLIGCFAEYERKLINERTQAGLAEAKSKGIKFGRPEIKIPMDEVKKDIVFGLSKSAICRKYGIKRATLYKKLVDSEAVMKEAYENQLKSEIEHKVKAEFEQKLQSEIQSRMKEEIAKRVEEAKKKEEIDRLVNEEIEKRLKSSV